MGNIILEFLEAYKCLDELCKQIMKSDRGISEYIDGMSKEPDGKREVDCWESDYKQLKRLRWIRNQLVHDSGSFHENIVTTKDIQWIKAFHSRILNYSDPYSLLFQSKNNKPIKQKEASNLNSQKQEALISNRESEDDIGISLIVAILLGLAMGICIWGCVVYI